MEYCFSVQFNYIGSAKGDPYGNVSDGKLSTCLDSMIYSNLTAPVKICDLVIDYLQ